MPPSDAAIAPQLPPPFPVVAPPATGKTMPPIPHINVAVEEPVVEKPLPAGKAKKKPLGKILVIGGGLAALLVLVGGGFWAWTVFLATPPPPPPPPPRAVVKPKPAAPVAAAPAVPSVADKPAAPLTPSETLNNLAHAPVNAVNKAQDAIAARRESGQTRVDVMAAGQDGPDKRAATKAAATANKPAVSASATIAPGISATTSDVDAVAEATPAFRTFVANAKITGVIAGTPGKIILNGRLARAGDVIDPTLGVVFDAIDAERKLLVFKDKTGAVVTRKF
jgi:hypothetical protein